MRVRFLIGLVCAVVAAMIQLYLRPAWRSFSELSIILLGSLPNFLAVLGLALLLLAFRKSTQRPNSTILAVLFGVLAHEVFTGSTPSSSFGGHFDWNDVIASVLGAIMAYWVDQRLRRSESKTT